MIRDTMAICPKTPFGERGASARIKGVWSVCAAALVLAGMSVLAPCCQAVPVGGVQGSPANVTPIAPSGQPTAEEFALRTFSVSGLSFDQVEAATGSSLTEDGAFELVRQINTLIVRDRLPGIMKVERVLDNLRVGNRDRKQVMVMSSLIDEATGTVLARPSFAMTEGFSGSYTRTSNVGIADEDGVFQDLDTGLVIDMVPQSVSDGSVTLKIGTTFSGTAKAGSIEDVRTARQETVVKVAQREQSTVRIKNPVSEKKDLIFRFIVSIL